MQVPSILCVGLTHRTAPVALRELVSNPPKSWDEYLGSALPPNAEWCVLSTCNRFEIYIALPWHPADDFSSESTYVSLSTPELSTPEIASNLIPTDPGIACIVELLAEVTKTDKESLWAHLYYVKNDAAAEHLCCVASGLESLVFGEPQILGQVTDMFMAATKRKSVGPALNILLRTAIRAGKRARYETVIGVNALSVSSVAIKIAESMVPDLASKRITVVGLGEMGQLTARGLKDRRLSRVNVVNRSYERAQAIAAEAGWYAHPMTNLPEVLAHSDIVFAATGATEPVITTQMMETAREVRHAQPASMKRSQRMLLFDMAVPRDVCPEVGNCAHVHLTDIDQLQSKADEALNARKDAIPEVHRIITEELVTYEVEMAGIRMRPLVVDLRLKAEQIRQNELKRTMGFIGASDPELVSHLQHFSKALVNKLLHEPTIHIKEMAHEQYVDEFVATVRNLFDLREEEIAEN